MRKTEYNHNRTENTEIYTARTSVARQNKKLKLNDRAFYIMIKIMVVIKTLCFLSGE